MKNLESLKRELEEFTPKRFNTVYCNLIDVAQTSDREYEILDALSFIASCNLMIDEVNEALVNKPGETNCLLCETKEETIQALKLANETLMENYHKLQEKIQDKEKLIQIMDETINKYREELTGKNNNLKVCKK